MCELLNYFCDCELKHRVEAIVSFADTFVLKLQYNQKYRYNELMQALNMSAALTARKTKEFRSPPQEQVDEDPSSVLAGNIEREKRARPSIILKYSVYYKGLYTTKNCSEGGILQYFFTIR